MNNWRAITKPSPPLLPLPHSTTIRSATSGQRGSDTQLPDVRHFPSEWTGIPRSIVRRSTPRISAAVSTFIAPPVDARLAAIHRRRPSRSENPRRNFGFGVRVEDHPGHLRIARTITPTSFAAPIAEAISPHTRCHRRHAPVRYRRPNRSLRNRETAQRAASGSPVPIAIRDV